ncbi:MAG: serine/threonine-protein kinase [Polyangiaceae bacterium]
MSSPSLPQPGEVVAEKYRIEEPLGEGGMAIVFAAHHLLLDKPIALKILSPNLPRLPLLRERFLTEARAAARVESPHVAAVMDVGTLPGGLPFMVLERLEGCDLGELLLVERQLAIGDAVDYVLQALQGLAHAHTLGVIHRDLKPANLFLDHQTDGSAIIKIVDFGIAKLNATNPDGSGGTVSRHTQQGHAVGTPMYMSPEHVRNETVDHRTDIWAMGVVLYELLTGQTPFEAEGIGETFGAVLNGKVVPAKTLRAEIPDALDAAISKCLARDLDDRWSDVAQLARAIAPFGTGACTFLVQSIEQTLRQTLRRYTGKQILARPITANAMIVNVDGPPSSRKNATEPAKPLAATMEASTSHVGPIVTPLPSEFPAQLRPRWGRWALGIALAIGGAAAYLMVLSKSAPVAATSVAPPVIETTAPSIAPAASTASAAPMATASVPASLTEAIKTIPEATSSAPKSKTGKKSRHAKH